VAVPVEPVDLNAVRGGLLRASDGSGDSAAILITNREVLLNAITPGRTTLTLWFAIWAASLARGVPWVLSGH
jgi:hypothetical protein